MEIDLCTEALARWRSATRRAVILGQLAGGTHAQAPKRRSSWEHPGHRACDPPLTAGGSARVLDVEAFSRTRVISTWTDQVRAAARSRSGSARCRWCNNSRWRRTSASRRRISGTGTVLLASFTPTFVRVSFTATTASSPRRCGHFHRGASSTRCRPASAGQHAWRGLGVVIRFDPDTAGSENRL